MTKFQTEFGGYLSQVFFILPYFFLYNTVTYCFNSFSFNLLQECDRKSRI